MPTLDSNQRQRFVEERREFIQNDLSNLNDMQKEAALCTEGPLLLLAGAGSGKTTVLIDRVYNILTYGKGSDKSVLDVPNFVSEVDLDYLIQVNLMKDKSGLDLRRLHRICSFDTPRPWEILAITFTNKAAGELKSRLAKRLGDLATDIWAHTFHSACVRILRKHIDKLEVRLSDKSSVKFNSKFTIYDSDDSKRVMKQVIKDSGLDDDRFSYKDVLNVIGKAKDRYEGVEDFKAKYSNSSDTWMMQVIDLYREYQLRLLSANALDFGDILVYTVKLLQECPDILRIYQNQFRYILVDEYQDTNHIQYLLISLLAGKHKNICVVGDDDQSIYSFRGADIGNILSFERQYPGARVIKLEQNYRSTKNILNAANAVIRNNCERKGKSLWTNNADGLQVEVCSVFDEQEESGYIAEGIMEAVGNGYQFSDIAILYRVNSLSNAIESTLKLYRIPYRIVGGLRFFERAEIKDMIAYLTLINNTDDDLRLKRIVNKPARKIGATTLGRVEEIAKEHQVSMFKIMEQSNQIDELRRVSSRLIQFVNMIKILQADLAQGMLLDDMYDKLCSISGYEEMLETKSKRDGEASNKLENIRELKSSIIDFMSKASSDEDRTLEAFLNEISLYTDTDDIKDDNCVVLMTIHAAKGLEYPIVYVVGMEEKLFPHIKSLFDPSALEEERRLCYVAMTRAKKRLTLMTVQCRMLFGLRSYNKCSRFLDELPPDGVIWIG